VSFAVAAEAYDRFMGRYSAPLAQLFSDLAGVEPGQTVLDVGCGPGALTNELVKRLGAESVSAVDPSRSFVAATRERYPGVRVELAGAEQLPYPDRTFDVTLAQLVVHHMADPVAGLTEMARVTRRDGIVAACVWDHAGDHGPLRLFWTAARQLDPGIDDESLLAGTSRGHLAELFRSVGLGAVEDSILTIAVEHPSFEDWWEPFTFGVGPAGGYLTSLDPERQNRIRQRCREMIPTVPFVVEAWAWAARGVVSA
jgi:SAM-dependent methyltransferase